MKSPANFRVGTPKSVSSLNPQKTFSLKSVCFAEYLPDPKEFELYLSMSADDGWCKHFDKEERACTIYEDRPRFCRVETETFGDMYGVDPEDMDDFCSGCCSEQIGDVYGGKRQVAVFFAWLFLACRGGLLLKLHTTRRCRFPAGQTTCGWIAVMVDLWNPFQLYTKYYSSSIVARDML